MQDVNSQPYNHPPKEKVLAHIDVLMAEDEKYKLVEFIDIFQKKYAMVKHIYFLTDTLIRLKESNAISGVMNLIMHKTH